MRVPWWLGLDPASADVECNGASHAVRWAAGRLHADDHPDVESEQALAALGGGAPPCLELMSLWSRYVEDVALVTLGRRPGEGPIRLEPTINPYGPGLGKGMPPAMQKEIEERFRRRTELERLLALPGPLVDRLVLTVFATCARRWYDEEFRSEHGLRVGAALHTRAVTALRRFGARLRLGEPEVTVSPSQPGAGPSFTARVDPPRPPMVHAELPVAWLLDVWGRGISEPDGQLVLAVRDADEFGREFVVDVAVWEQAGHDSWELAAVPGHVSLDDDGRWILQADPQATV